MPESAPTGANAPDAGLPTAPGLSGLDAGAGPDAHMRFLCDLCERLIAQMNVLTDRYEEEKRTTAALQADLEAQRAETQDWKRKTQKLEAQLRMDADVLQQVNATLVVREREMQYRLDMLDVEKRELAHQLERRHQRELSALRAKYERELATASGLGASRLLLDAHEPPPAAIHAPRRSKSRDPGRPQSARPHPRVHDSISPARGAGGHPIRTHRTAAVSPPRPPRPEWDFDARLGRAVQRPRGRRQHISP